MKIYDEQDFIDIIRKSLQPLSFEDFSKTEQLSLLWDKLEEDDIRKTTLQTKENFYRWCYEFIHNDEPLKYYFNKRLAFKEPVSVKILDIDNKVIKNTPNNVRLIRNINLESMLDSQGFDGASIKNAYKEALEYGKVNRFITMPSVFKDSCKNDYGSFAVTMKTITGQMSVFSPSVYKTLLEETNKYTKKVKQKLLIPSASWCSSILAIDNNCYSAVHIVDVQEKVLQTCFDLYNFLNLGGNLFQDKLFDLKTFTIQSEIMTEVVDNDYDKIFFCPPYYDLELYGGSDKQSTSLYSTYEEWLKSYWKQTVEQCYKVLNTDGLFCFVMGKYIRGYQMGDDMRNIANEYFDLLDEIKISPPKEVTRSNEHLEKYELCYIMKKKGD
jgi:hypothetical protein